MKSVTRISIGTDHKNAEKTPIIDVITLENRHKDSVKLHEKHGTSQSITDESKIWIRYLIMILLGKKTNSHTPRDEKTVIQLSK